MTEKRFDIDAQDNARVNAVNELNANTVNFGDRINSQQRVSVIGLDPIPPAHRADKWIDRSEPQAELLQRIQAGEKSIELVAAGGFGKSLLAAWLFHRVKGEFDRSLWLNFRKLPTFNELARWVLQEIGYLIDDPRVDDAALINELTYRLTEKRCLLILDQLEAIDSAKDRDSFVEFLQTWQERGHTSAIVVTTRPSFVGTGHDRIDLAGFTDREGADFLKRQGIQTAEEQPLFSLVRIAEGHPLLLNLAASWLRQEARGEINPAGLDFFERLFQKYKGKGNAEAKVEEIFGELFAELPESLRSLLLGVVVYRDAFGLEMAQAMRSTATIEDLQELTARAFLVEESAGWTLHPLMENLVYLALKSSDIYGEFHQNAIAYFTSKIKPEKESIADCAEELEIFHHHCELGEYATAYQIMHTCVNFLHRQGYYRDLLPIYDRLTQAWTEANPNDIEEQKNLGWGWTRLGNLYLSVGQYQAAISAYKQAQIRFDLINFSKGKAAFFIGLGNAYYFLSEYQQAIDFYQQSLAIEQKIGNRQGESISLNNLGNVYDSLSEYGQAIDFHQQSLAIKQQIGDYHGEASSLDNLGSVYNSLGEYRQAIDFHQQSLAIEQQIGDLQGEVHSLGNLGNAYNSLGEYRQAIEFMQQSLEIGRHIGDRRCESSSLNLLGKAYNSLGEYRQAIDFYQQSLEIKQQIGDRRGEVHSLIGLGNAYYFLSEYQQAIDFYQQSLEIQQQIGDRQGESNSLFNLSNCYQQRWQFNRSREYRHQAYRIWQERQLLLETLPLSDFQKRMLRSVGDDWIEQLIQIEQKLAWFHNTSYSISFSIRWLLSPLRWIRRQLRSQK